MTSKPPLSTSINFGHPLAQGLICCLLANEMGGPLIDAVSGNRVALTASGVRGNFAFGPGLDSTSPSAAGATATLWDQLKQPTTECTVLFRGNVTSGGAGFSALFGLAYASPSADPFYVYYLDRGSTGATVRMNWNAGGVQNNLAGTPTAYDGSERQYVGVIRGSSGLCELYETAANGLMTRLANTTANFGPNFTASSHLDLGGPETFRHGYIWRRALTPAEIQWIWQEPYAFLGKQQRRIALVLTPPASGVVFRRTRSEIGTRSGARQMVS